MLSFVLLAATVVLDIVGQVLFKLGVGHDSDDASASTPTGGIVGFLRDVLGSPWIIAGVVVYAAEFVVWFAALTRIPLNEAFPFNALAYCGVVVASRYLLHETVSAKRWLGTLLIALGVMLVFVP